MKLSRESLAGLRSAGLRLLPLLVLMAVGGTLELLGVVDWHQALDWARGYSGWTLAACIVAAQIAMFAFAQPGSALFWVAALLYSPVVATGILTTGGTAGAVAAYGVARRALRSTAGAPPPIYGAIASHGDFLTLCALRLVPGMPHSVLNYGAGVLRVPLGRFVAATIPGLAAKSFLYASVAAQLSDAASPADLVAADTLVPLLALAALLLLAHVVLHRRKPRLT